MKGHVTDKNINLSAKEKTNKKNILLKINVSPIMIYLNINSVNLSLLDLVSQRRFNKLCIVNNNL